MTIGHFVPFADVRAYAAERRRRRAGESKSIRKRKAKFVVDLSVQKAQIMAKRRQANAQEWENFIVRGYDHVWRFVFPEKALTCPSLELHAAEFRDYLKTGAVPLNLQRHGESFTCELHRLFVQKLARSRVRS